MANKKPVYSKYGHKLAFTYKPHKCSGCGRLLPRYSYVLMWSVWTRGLKNRFRFCSDCENVIYGCNNRESVNNKDEQMVRAICSRCDRYPTCELVDYLRKEQPGKWFFGDMEKANHHVHDNDNTL